MRRFYSSTEQHHVLSSAAGSPHQSMCSMADERDLLPSWERSSLSFNRATDCFQQHLHKRDVVSIEPPPPLLSISRHYWFSFLFHSHPFFFFVYLTLIPHFFFSLHFSFYLPLPFPISKVAVMWLEFMFGIREFPVSISVLRLHLLIDLLCCSLAPLDISRNAT